jgi:uridine kinase
VVLSGGGVMKIVSGHAENDKPECREKGRRWQETAPGNILHNGSFYCRISAAAAKFTRPAGTKKEPMTAEIIEKILEAIRSVKNERPALVAFDGVDTAGKTTLADAAAEQMRRHGPGTPVRVSLDKFHYPKNIRNARGALSHEGYFHDSFDYTSVLECVIKPVRENAGHLVPGVFDYNANSKITLRPIPVSPDLVVLFDGIFLNRDELASVWDLSIFLDISFDTMRQRALARDLTLFPAEEEIRKRYENRYIPGQRLYLAQCRPQERAHIVIDNNDYHHPCIIKFQPPGSQSPPRA